MKYLRTLVLFILIYLNSMYSQTWEEDYYDNEILYENAELLQLTEYELNLIKIKNLEKQFENQDSNSATVLSQDDQVFFDLENASLENTNIQTSSGPSFQDMVETINSARTENILFNDL